MQALDPSFRAEFGVTLPILGVAALSGPYDFYPFEYNEVRDVFGEAPSPEGTQPINLITAESPAVLLFIVLALAAGFVTAQSPYASPFRWLSSVAIGGLTLSAIALLVLARD